MTSQPHREMSKKSCMFQFTTRFGKFFPDYKMYEDTGLITYNEAKKLWHKYLPQWLKDYAREDAGPEMAIWINCKDNLDYHTAVAHLNQNTLVKDNKPYEVIYKAIGPSEVLL